MAKVMFEAGLKPVRGRVDDWVFRELHGQTLVSKYVASSKKPTAAQREMRLRFKQAAAYAKSVAGSAVWHEVYAPYARKNGRSVFSAAVADYLKPPVVSAINLRDYRGKIGDPIVVSATDEFGVVAVRVEIQTKDLRLQEEGSAVLESNVWVYRATTVQAPGQPLIITVTAFDRPSHTGSKQQAWSP